MRVAVAAPAALRHEHAIIRIYEIVEQFARFIIVNSRTDWNSDFQIFSAPAMTITSFTVPAPFRAKNVIEPKFQKGVLVQVRNEIDIAAVTAIATAGTAPRNEFFSSKRD